MTLPRIASRDEWLTARKELLTKEKEATRARDELTAERRGLPMVKIDKEYLFDGLSGKASLFDLFDGRQQLIVYHFMFDPSWDEGCSSCSLLTDHIGHLSHLHFKDTSLALVSRAPLTKIERFRERMGWAIPWFSSFGTDFNYDFHVTMDESVTPVEYNFKDKAELEQAGMPWHTSGEQHGLSVFLRDGDTVFHTYSSYGRGLEGLLGVYSYLDLTPLGRQEASGMPGVTQFHHHDKYDTQ